MATPAFNLNACQRCGGSLHTQTDEDGEYTSCLTCARVWYPDVRAERKIDVLTEYRTLRRENPDYVENIQLLAAQRRAEVVEEIPEPTPKRQPPTESAITLVRQLYRRNQTWNQIIAASGVTESRARAVVTDSDRAERERVKAEQIEALKAQCVRLARLREMGMTRTELAELTGLPKTTVDGRVQRGKRYRERAET